MKAYEILARNVLSERLKRNFTQADLAQRAGVAERILHELENVRSPNIYLRTVEAIAGALELTVSQLLSESLPQFAGKRQRAYKTRVTRIDDTSIAAPHKPGPKALPRDGAPFYSELSKKYRKPGRPQPRNHPWRRS